MHGCSTMGEMVPRDKGAFFNFVSSKFRKLKPIKQGGESVAITTLNRKPVPEYATSRSVCRLLFHLNRPSFRMYVGSHLGPNPSDWVEKKNTHTK